MHFSISQNKRTVTSDVPVRYLLLDRERDFFGVSVPKYLVHATEMNATGGLVILQNILGGDIFTKRSPVLPLEEVVQTYGNDKAGFLDRGLAGGERS